MSGLGLKVSRSRAGCRVPLGISSSIMGCTKLVLNRPRLKVEGSGFSTSGERGKGLELGIPVLNFGAPCALLELNQ